MPQRGVKPAPTPISYPLPVPNPVGGVAFASSMPIIVTPDAVAPELDDDIPAVGEVGDDDIENVEEVKNAD